MGWERRQRGGQYYYRSRRVGGRVIKEYLGAGSEAKLAAGVDSLRRKQRKEKRDAERQDRQSYEDALGPLQDFLARCKSIARARLLLAGYHQHDRGEWRRRDDRAKAKPTG